VSWVKRGMLGLVAAFAVLVGVLLLECHAHAERLVTDATRLSSDRPRSVHREPAEGTTYDACLGKVIDAKPADCGAYGSTASDEQKQAVAKVLDEANLALLPERARTEADELWPWAASALRCTHAPGLGQEPGVGAFADWDHPRAADGGLLVQTIARLAAIRVLVSTAEARPGDALTVCADGLALSRDSALDGGLIGSMLAVAMTGRLVPACGQALDAASPEQRVRFLEELSRIRKAFPSFADVLEVESVEMQLMAFGGLLTGSELRRLPENARALAAKHMASTGFLGTVLFWGPFLKQHNALRAAATRNAPDDELERIAHSEDNLAALLVGGPGDGNWVAYRRRYARVGLAFDLLESAARVKDRGAALPGVRQQEEGDALRLSVPWDDKGTRSIVVHPGEASPVPSEP